MEVLLEMRSTKFHHYSVAIGGFVDGNEYGDESNIVEAFFVNFFCHIHGTGCRKRV